MDTTLKQMHIGDSGVVVGIGSKGPMKRRLMEMGVTPGADIRVVKVAPLGDPIEVTLRGYELSLRKNEAEQIKVRLDAALKG